MRTMIDSLQVSSSFKERLVIHNLNGHRSYCTAVEFHLFGEFLASGSMDTNLKIWDIRKKGCTHTYKNHSRGISTMKFTPNGRWVVSAGLDHVVKVWDLTAGKLLHDFKLYQGHIRSLEFIRLNFCWQQDSHLRFRYAITDQWVAQKM